MCGKNSTLSVLLKKVLGSPPRVREKLSPTLAHSIKSRITPACAGKTEILTIHSTFKRDHPRVCGKNSGVGLSGCCVSGSPPRVREKLKQRTDTIEPIGITPACAGKTLVLVRSLPKYRDHPRVCGKNQWESYTAKTERGSPPRVREKPNAFLNSSCDTGITPACAGKTLSQLQGGMMEQDHPRVCGKNHFLSLFFYFTEGSPPRVREKLESIGKAAGSIGITPACAGKTESFLALLKFF